MRNINIIKFPFEEAFLQSIFLKFDPFASKISRIIFSLKVKIKQCTTLRCKNQSCTFQGYLCRRIDRTKSNEISRILMVQSWKFRRSKGLENSCRQAPNYLDPTMITNQILNYFLTSKHDSDLKMFAEKVQHCDDIHNKSHENQDGIPCYRIKKKNANPNFGFNFATMCIFLF